MCDTHAVRMFLWLGAFLVLLVVASFISWGVEWATDSIFWMLVAGGIVLVGGLWIMIRLFLRQDDLDY